MDNQDRFFRDIMNKAAGQKVKLLEELERHIPFEQDVFAFAKWFKRYYMTWLPEVPRCGQCDSLPMELTVYGFDSAYQFTPDPSHWTGFKRMPTSRAITCRKVERYVCLKCHDVRVATRENNPLILIKTREGRCGEHAILFTAFCLALGMRARLVVAKDADHVWTEILMSQFSDRWTPVDPSVEETDRIEQDPNLFKRWGWKLTNIVAYEPYQDPVDVSDVYA